MDDGSSDKTSRACSEFFKVNGRGKVISNSSNFGKGYSVRRGMLEAEGGLCLFTDADMSYPIAQVSKFILAAEKDRGIAIASRGLPESDVRVRQLFYREKMGEFFNLLVRLVAVKGIADTQCGFKLFRGECVRELFRKTKLNRFSFDVEVLFLANKLGYSVRELPAVWIHPGNSSVNVLKDSLERLIDICYIRLLWLTGRYKS